MVDEVLQGENSLFTAIILSLGIILFLAVGLVLFFFFSRKKIVKAQLEKAELEIRSQRELIQATLLTQEEERKRIAQDLHDAISSKLNVVALNANLLREAGMETGEVVTVGEKIVQVTGDVLENSRRIAHDLLPPTLVKFGLEAAMEELMEEVEDTGKYELIMDMEYQPGLLSEEEELQLFRIVQECLNNTIKHAEASQLSLGLKGNQKTVLLEYSDDGVGFDWDNNKQRSKGLGLSGLENRVELLRGDLHVDSAPGQGFKLTAKIDRS